MNILSNLRPAEGSIKKKKRIGRGEGSGHGGTSTRGMNGQLSRSGAKKKRGFEGGQMPLQRRVPKFGFKNPFKKVYQIVNVQDIQKLVENKKIKEDEVVNINVLLEAGLVSKKNLPIKILGSGEIKSKVKLEANAFSQSAKQKVETAGGSVRVI